MKGRQTEQVEWWERYRCSYLENPSVISVTRIGWSGRLARTCQTRCTCHGLVGKPYFRL